MGKRSEFFTVAEVKTALSKLMLAGGGDLPLHYYAIDDAEYLVEMTAADLLGEIDDEKFLSIIVDDEYSLFTGDCRYDPIIEIRLCLNKSHNYIAIGYDDMMGEVIDDMIDAAPDDLPEATNVDMIDEIIDAAKVDMPDATEGELIEATMDDVIDAMNDE